MSGYACTHYVYVACLYGFDSSNNTMLCIKVSWNMPNITVLKLHVWFSSDCFQMKQIYILNTVMSETNHIIIHIWIWFGTLLYSHWILRSYVAYMQNLSNTLSGIFLTLNHVDFVLSIQWHTSLPKTQPVMMHWNCLQSSRPRPYFPCKITLYNILFKYILQLLADVGQIS